MSFPLTPSLSRGERVKNLEPRGLDLDRHRRRQDRTPDAVFAAETIANRAAAAFPFGLGWHPFFPGDVTTVLGFVAGGANFGALSANGGPTQTHSLLAGSAAIDAGNLGGCTDDVGALLKRDQRGVKRHNPDIGAFERV